MVDEEIRYRCEIVLWSCPMCGLEFDAPNEDFAECPRCGKILENGMPRRGELS